MKKPMFDTFMEYEAYFKGVRKGVIIGGLAVLTIDFIFFVLRWLRIW